ncbi:hypothetical protein SUGI_0959510 [Cryptomeria japonica]|nr:hypothetical protein SUGI_0959510 [Cryptomeria japonica]
MVAGSFSIEIESPVERKRLWRATVDSHNLLPKQARGLISGITLAQANKDFSYMKEKVDLVDEANLVYGYSLVEGGMLGGKSGVSKPQE